jgi:GMP synthase (glutamine-hydrolysing)
MVRRVGSCTVCEVMQPDGVPDRALAILITGEPVASARKQGGSFAELIQRAVGDAWAGPWLAVDLRHGDPLPHPTSIAGVIVTGSAAFLNEGAAWMRNGMEYLHSLIDAGTPVFGICFGHQMLGQALGGRIGRNPHGREIGTRTMTPLADHPLLPLEHGPLSVHTTHMDSVTELPPGARVLARTELEPHALVRFSEFAWGVQFHPEMDGEVMRCYIREQRSALRSEGLDPDQLLKQVTETPASRALLQRFVECYVVSSV